MRPFVVARQKEPFEAANGIQIPARLRLRNLPSPADRLHPRLLREPGDKRAGQYDPEARWLKSVHDSGAMLASACSGAVLLGEAGLLDGCDATIHWGYVKTLTTNYPGVSVRQDQSLVLTGTRSAS